MGLKPFFAISLRHIYLHQHLTDCFLHVSSGGFLETELVLLVRPEPKGPAGAATAAACITSGFSSNDRLTGTGPSQ